jgi:transcriptional regulator with XRE-family HTH domain
LPKGFQDQRYRRLISRLVTERQALGLSQLTLGAKLGTHQQFVSRYETGERRLDVMEFHDVATHLGLDPLRIIHDVLSE